MFFIGLTCTHFLFAIKQSYDFSEAGTVVTIYEGCSFSEGRGTDTWLIAKCLGLQAEDFPRGAWLNRCVCFLMKIWVDF